MTTASRFRVHSHGPESEAPTPPIARDSVLSGTPGVMEVIDVQPGHEHELLVTERDRAERRLNGVRAIVLSMLAVVAAFYAPALPLRLNVVNAVLLIPMLSWTAFQYLAYYRRPRIPTWLAIVNPVADILAVTITMGAYGWYSSPPLALKSPMVLSYVVILSGRPIASSVRNAAIVAVLVVIAYLSLDLFFILQNAVVLRDPVTASIGPGISLLDEATKLALLASAGGIATYATAWHEQLTRQYSAEAREREVLQARLAASRLDTLKQQLQPHFLFNALNAMAALVDTDPAGAQRMIAGLGKLIRVSLDSGGDQEVPLREELAILEEYLAIQRMRFEDRLAVTIDANVDVADALVPTLILQPLVENSIKYGLGSFAAPGRIDVRAHRDGDMLAMSVSDDGPGLRGKPIDTIVERVGVGNARARLTYLYGDAHQFTLESPPDGGFIVRMRIPYRPAPDHTGVTHG
jgi:signal transduction histidine kinase